MGSNYQFIDTAFPDGANDRSADPILTVLKANNLHGFSFYIGGDICLHAWPKPIVDAIRAQYPGMAIHVPDLDTGDGAEAVALAQAYGLPAGYFIALDIEPGIYRSKGTPQAAASFSDPWCDAVRAAGFVPVVYGTAETVAACANHADYIWITDPGQPNPATPGLPPSQVGIILADAFFAVRRAIQYDQLVLNGITVDINNSQFPLSPGAFGAGGGSLGGFLMALSDADQEWVKQLVAETHQAVGRLEHALGTVDPSGAVQAPDYLGWSRDETAREQAILAALADLKAHPAAADPAVLAIATRIETALKAA